MRRVLSSPIQVYRLAQKENYPDTFQILCHNCNLARGFYGYCPHEVEKGNS